MHVTAKLQPFATTYCARNYRDLDTSVYVRVARWRWVCATEGMRALHP